MEKNQWDRYMSCDARPNPTCKRDINTYINLTKENISTFSLQHVLKECELIIELIDELDYHIKDTDLDLAFVTEENSEEIVNNLQNKKNDYLESKKDLQELIMLALDSSTFTLLENPEGFIDPDTFNISTIKSSSNVRMCIWGNAAKNPRVKQIEFEKDSFTMELPKQMALAEIAVRVLYLKFDFLSHNCDTYTYVPPPPPPPKSEEIVIIEEELTNEQNENEQKETENGDKESKLTQNQPSPAPSTRTMLSVKENRKVSRIRSGTARSVLSTKKDASMSRLSRLSNINTEEEKIKLDQEEVETVIKSELRETIDEHIMNLRSNSLLGALMHIELLELPMQAKEVHGWHIQQISHNGLQKIIYGAETKQEEMETPDGSQISISTNLGTSTLGYNLPIMLSFSIDERVILHEHPQVARWDSEQSHWTKEGINDLRYEADERLVFFRTKHFGPFSIFQNMYANMPFKGWTLRPLCLNQCVFQITGLVMNIEIYVKDNLCCAVFSEKPKQLQHVANQWMDPEKLATSLRSVGSNFFPFVDGGKYCKISEKVDTFVEAVYQHMAMTSSCFTFLSSQWNSGCGEEKIVVRAGECLNGIINENDTFLYMASPRICSQLDMEENSPEFCADVKEGSQMHPDLYHMLRDGVSEKAKQLLQDSSVEYIDCVRRLLNSVNPYVFTSAATVTNP